MMIKHHLGIYEKALPKDMDWTERLNLVKKLGFDFIEMSIDETDGRLARLEWSKAERLALIQQVFEIGIPIQSICLSAHRRFPFGSSNKEVREKAYEIMEKAIDLSVDLGVRIIQLAGYDVYYEMSNEQTKQYFLEGIQWAVQLAAAKQVTLSMEIMDTKFMNSITKWKELEKQIKSPWFTVYPDIGNLSAWNSDVLGELSLGIDQISAIHLKDTYPVTETDSGTFRNVPFGKGCVQFLDIFRCLAKLNYRGAFLIEMWADSSENPIEQVAYAKNWIEDQMKKGGLLC